MTISIIILFISFLLDGLLSLYKYYLLFDLFYINTLFTVTALVLIYPLLQNNYKSYYKISFIVGLFYDIVYTNTLLLNSAIFLLLSLIIRYYYININNNLVNSFIINIINIVLYQVIFFIILCLVGYLPLNFRLLFNDNLSFIIINSVYFIILYIIIRVICRKWKIRYFE